MKENESLPNTETTTFEIALTTIDTPVDGADEAASATTTAAAADIVKIPLEKPQFILVFVGLLLAVFLTGLDQSITSTALKAIIEDFGRQDLVSWIGSSYLLASAGSGTLYGKLADIFGRKSALVFAVCVFELGSIISGISKSMIGLIVGRAISGVGGGGILPLVMIVITDIVSLRDRGKYQGMIGGIAGISAIIAPLIGGAITDSGNWRWCFFLNLPFGFLKFPSEKGSFVEKILRIDFYGAFFLVAAIFCLLTPLQLGGSTWNWNSGQTIGMLVASVVLLVIFIYIELRVAKEPIVPAAIFANSSVPGLLAIFATLGCGMISGTYFISLFFQVVFGATATQGGVATIPTMVGLMITMIVSGIIVSKTGKYMIFFYVGPVILAVGIGFISILSKNSTEAVKIIYLFIFGLGCGTMLQVRALAIQASVPLHLLAIVTAAGPTFNTLGGSIGVAIVGTIFNNVMANWIAGARELEEFINKFASNGISVDSSDTLQILELLQSSVGGYPVGNVTEAAIYNATLANATSQLIDGFTHAFNLAYLCLLVAPAVILVVAVAFVRQFDMGGGGKSAEWH
ncbi:hypothetical protein HK100_012710 [Physocladia obscura]|uniref:Major facilitator superfamily (MFS) profile domain-containing protein n=1 Tax=Physocladia obscura TaxID=109957 RepID=A0AAD5T0U4_9FUNG|nr:hypothetical protein HK100_012710 [Physocladia obscura]